MPTTKIERSGSNILVSYSSGRKKPADLKAARPVAKTQAKSHDSNRRRYLRLIRRMSLPFTQDAYFVTLTFARSEYSPTRVLRHLRELTSARGVELLAVLELHETNGFHVHALSNKEIMDVAGHELNRYLAFDSHSQEHLMWTHGGADCARVQSQAACRDYLMKQLYQTDSKAFVTYRGRAKQMSAMELVNSFSGASLVFYTQNLKTKLESSVRQHTTFEEALVETLVDYAMRNPDVNRTPSALLLRTSLFYRKTEYGASWLIATNSTPTKLSRYLLKKPRFCHKLQTALRSIANLEPS